MICRLGEVDVWVRNASVNASSTESKSSSLTRMRDPWRNEESDLWTECVAYTRMRTLSGSGSRRRSSSLASLPSSSPTCFLNASYSAR